MNSWVLFCIRCNCWSLSLRLIPAMCFSCQAEARQKERKLFKQNRKTHQCSLITWARLGKIKKNALLLALLVLVLPGVRVKLRSIPNIFAICISFALFIKNKSTKISMTKPETQKSSSFSYQLIEKELHRHNRHKFIWYAHSIFFFRLLQYTHF